MKIQPSIDFRRNSQTATHKYFYLFLLIPILFIAYPLFSNPGIPIGNGDLPYIEISLYSFKKFWTWNEYGSYHGLETLPRYPIIAAFQLVNILPDITSKLLIVGGFAIASFSFYFSFRRLFKYRLDIEGLRFNIAAILGSLFYAYNAWSFQRLGHWYFWLGYAILPLFFVSVIYAFRNPRKWKYVLATVLLWSVASSTPHMAVFYGIIFVGLSAIFVVRYINRNHSLKIPITRPLLLILAAYVFINFYWIYPYLVSSTSESFLWSAVVTEEITRDLSQESQLPNVFRLIEGTFNMGIIEVVPTQASGLYPLWLIASFVPPILAFSALIWRRFYRYTLFFSAAAIIGILLTMGTNAPLNLYSVLLFYTPLTSYLQILFREPDKWGFLIAFGYSFLISIATVNILDKLRSSDYKKKINTKNVLSACFALFTLSSVIIYFFPAYYDSMYDLYRPVVLPNDFDILQENLKYSGVNRVFSTPYSPSNTTWVKNMGTFDLYHVGTPVPNIAAYDYNNIEKYHKYLLDSVVTNKTNKIEDILYPLGTSYLLFHNDTIVPFNKHVLDRLLSTIDGTRLIDSFGFFKLFRVGDSEKEIPELSIPRDNALIVGGLDQLSSLSYIESFNPINSTLVFLDQKIKDRNDKPILDNANYIILNPSAYDFVLSFIDKEYLVEPFLATIHHEPSKVWSKAGADDPGNAWFTPYLEYLGMHNSDFDYGKGLVMTEAMGAKLSIPLQIAPSGDYEIFIRYLHNQKGGMIKVYLDDMLIDEINTKNTRTNNNFVWKKINVNGDNYSSPLYLREGQHTLTLENVAGLNAVNIFAVIPQDQMAKLEKDAFSLANKSKNVYILEAESNFYNNKGRIVNRSTYTTNGLSDIITGQLKVPANTDLVSFTTSEINGYLNSSLVDNSNASNSGYSFKSLEVLPTYQTAELFRSNFETNEHEDGFAADFENNKEKLTLATLRHISSKEISWKEEEQSNLSAITIDRNTPISGNASLRVDVKKGNTLSWNVISTDFIDIDNESKSVEISMAASTRDVNQFHSKITYYNENKMQIASNFLFGGRDGTFRENFTNVQILPPDTKYMKMQILTRPNPTKSSSYIVDDIKVLPFSTKGWENYNDLANTSIDQGTPISGNASLRVDVKKGNTLSWNVISTEFIPVSDQSYYKVSLNVSAKGVNQLHPKITYYDENKKQITNLDNEPLEETIFPGLDGDFKKGFVGTPLFPLGTKYIKLQVLTRPNFETESTYQIDDIIVRDVTPELAKPNNIDLQTTRLEELDTISQMQELDRQIPNGKANELSSKDLDNSNGNNGTALMVHQTKPIPVKENGIYNFSIAVEPSVRATREPINMDLRYPLAPILVANYANGSDIIETSTKYGAKASAGSVLSLSPQSEIYSDLDILRPANYTIALRVGSNDSSISTCHAAPVQCVSNGNNDDLNANSSNQHNTKSFISLSFMKKEDGIENRIDNNVIDSNEIYLEDTAEKNAGNSTSPGGESQLKWIYLNNIYLEKGKYEIKVSSNSDSIMDLDSIVIYSTSDINSESNNITNYVNIHNDTSIADANKIRYEPIENIFDSNADPNSNIDIDSRSAYIEKYDKIDPTRYKVDIRNATRPYIMSFAESYDPLWIAYTDNLTSDPKSNYELQISNSNNSKSMTDKDYNFKIRSVPLYSTVNGFYINRTGDYSLVIEYEPQIWFLQAGIVSVAALILSITVLVIQERKLERSRYSQGINQSFSAVSGILGLKYLRFWKRNHR